VEGHHDEGAHAKEAELHNIFSKLSMADVYNKSSHTIEDMVIR
jgi:hypothetical protein